MRRFAGIRSAGAAHLAAAPSAVPPAAFGFAQGGARVDARPRAIGAGSGASPAELGYDGAARATPRASRPL